MIFGNSCNAWLLCKLALCSVLLGSAWSLDNGLALTPVMGTIARTSGCTARAALILRSRALRLTYCRLRLQQVGTPGTTFDAREVTGAKVSAFRATPPWTTVCPKS